MSSFEIHLVWALILFAAGAFLEALWVEGTGDPGYADPYYSRNNVNG